MQSHTQTPPRIFTLDEANATLPLVRVIMRDIVNLSTSMVQTRSRLDSISAGPNISPMYREEIQDIEHRLEEERQTLQQYVDELIQLGVEPKGLTEGLVDFPATRDGEIVCLCWRYNEPTISHWHTQSAGFQGRRPIDSHLINSEDN